MGLELACQRFRGWCGFSTINLFVVWFFLCIFLTYTGVWRVGNVAHGMGALLGALLGFCIVAQGSRRQLAQATLGLVVAADLLLASYGRQSPRLCGVDPKPGHDQAWPLERMASGVH